VDRDADDFIISEDGVPLTPDRTRQVLHDKDSVAARHTLVLLDVSDGVDPVVQRELRDSIWLFVDRVEETQSVSVYGFDGAQRLRSIANFPRQSKPRRLPETARVPIPRGDRSRNLYGATLAAKEELDRRLASTGRALRLGSLVVFSAGPDLAGRKEAHEASLALGDSGYRVLGISYGDGTRAVRPLTTHGFFDAHEARGVALAFEDAAHQVVTFYEQEYVLSYCSPARAGVRHLEIEVSRAPEGQPERRGAASAEFNADGFSGECDPTLPARFDSGSLR
jgi:hypothetical protein